ncbi:penicillin-binding protein activator LpoA precursor [mine drainage metagenome]|uniref:Penicillin-binding protein activator LpoA n=1 Tax=mine drainage metagenome TaxID=410659 RepID=A0A1J5S9G8_9ZZZZ
MNLLRHLLQIAAALKISVSLILQGHPRMLQHILLRLCCIFLSIVSINNTALANDTVNSVIKVSAEEAFLQGQQYLEQAKLPLAELNLTRIPRASPYAKLLAGNIAIQRSEFDRAFLLLLPLQSNQSLTKVAAASLHASLSVAYEKQGDIPNALDQLMRRETYLKDTSSINSNHGRIWQLLSSLSLQDLITMRGESADTTAQGWVDLCLATKNQDVISSINAWAASYPDHVAGDFSKTLITQLMAQKNTDQSKTTYTLPSNGSIALILPPDIDPLSPKANAFHDGLQAALNKYALLNVIKTYPSLGTEDSIAEQVSLAKSEGAVYFMTPLFHQTLNESTSDKNSITWQDDAMGSNSILQGADLSINDEAQTIAAFASSNAMQHITIIATNDDAANLMVKSFQAALENAPEANVRVITLAANIKSDDPNLLDLKTKISEQANDMILLATSATDARIIRPYLDISTPVLAFSNLNEIANDEALNSPLNAVRFVDIPFLINKNDEKFSDYRKSSSNISSNELLRYFALGADYLQLLIASTQLANGELIVNGLTGKLSIDKTGKIQRQLSMAKFTYNGIVQEQ